jgi:hypothetical protein
MLHNISAVTSCVISTGSPAVTISSYTSTDILHPQDGVYLVPFTNNKLEGTAFSDLWSVKLNANVSSSITMTFTSTTIPWTLGPVAAMSPATYDFVVPNIKPIYSLGERPTLIIRARQYYQTGFTVLDSIEYRLVLKDADSGIEAIPWTLVNYSATENFIILDTRWLIAEQTYELQFRYSDNGAIIYDSSVKTFKVR